MLKPSRVLETARAIAQDATIAEVVSTMRARGVHPLVIKGPAVARWLYNDPGERPFNDIDLLVDPASYDAAARCLAELGFRDERAGLRTNEQHPNEESAWLRISDREVWVELHHKLALIPVSPDVAWERLSADPQPLTIAGIEIDTPNPAAHLVILALHATHHGVEHAKPLNDLRRAIRRIDASTWHMASTLATELGAAGAVREGLQLVDGGLELADRLGLAGDAPRAARLHARGAPPTAIGIERLVTTSGMRGRLALIASRLGPSPSFMREWLPLARRGRLGLTAAYLWRPFWLASQLPRGLAAWSAAAVPQDRRRRFPGFIAGASWGLRAWWRCRGQLRAGGLQGVALPAPPAERPGTQNGVERALDAVDATCLERALVRQRWHAAHGHLRDVVIGVRGPSVDFHAHAWLDGDPEDCSLFTELTRWPPT